MKTKPTMNNMRGFTLVELMIVVLLTAIAVIAIYRGYTAFSQSADAQEQIIEMQQNLRIGMYWIEKDLRRAGMNEEDDENAGFLLDKDELTHDPPVSPLFPGDSHVNSYVSFTMDLGGTNRTIDDEAWNSGDPGDGGLTDEGEWLTYKLVDAVLPSPVPPAPWTNFFNLVKTDENNSDPDVPLDLPIITNVDALDFVYLADDRVVGDEPVEDPNDRFMDDLDPDASTDDETTGRNILSDDDKLLIRSVQITMVVRTTNEDYRYTNTEWYRNLQGDVIYKAPGDNFRRRMFSKEIKIRNAGL